MTVTPPVATAFGGDPELKRVLVGGADHHDRHMCNLVCATVRYCCDPTQWGGHEHLAYEGLGIPRSLRHLQNGIFTGLPCERRYTFPGEFWRAIPVGADLGMVVPRFLCWLLLDPDRGVVRHVDDAGRPAIQGVGDLLDRTIAGEAVSDPDVVASIAAVRVTTATTRDGRAATRSAEEAAWAVWGGRESAWLVEPAASRAAAAAVTFVSVFEPVARSHQADQLLTLLSEAPVPE